jgi:hypothetical protein
LWQVAADIARDAIKKVIDLCVEGAKVIDVCIEGDKLLEQGTGAVYNKPVKGVKVSKGTFFFSFTKISSYLVFDPFYPLPSALF